MDELAAADRRAHNRVTVPWGEIGVARIETSTDSVTGTVRDVSRRGASIVVDRTDRAIAIGTVAIVMIGDAALDAVVRSAAPAGAWESIYGLEFLHADDSPPAALLALLTESDSEPIDKPDGPIER